MREIVEFLQFVGMTNTQIVGLALMSIGALIAYILNVFHGRFFRYTINGVEVIKDRELNREYIVYKGRELF